MMKYKVLMITPRLDIGGEELSTMAIADELKKRGHQVYYMSSGGPLLKELTIKNIDYLRGKVNGRGLLGIIRGGVEIRKAIVRHNIDIIHCAEPRPTIMGFIATRSILSRNTKVIWHNRGTMNHFLSGKIFNFLCDFVITNSNSERNKLIKNGLSLKKVRTIHNCFYLFSSEKKSGNGKIMEEFDLQSGKPIVGITGRLIHRKGHQYFLEAAYRILKKIPQAKFLIAGGGPLEKELRESTLALEIEGSVRFAGFRRDLDQIYPILDIIIVPSTYEPFGNVSLEAMAFSKPVVASNIDGIPEVVEDGTTGILVPPRDPKRLADAIIYLIENPDVARKMGEAGRKRVMEYFTIERVGDELEEVYGRVIAGKK